MRIAFIPRYDRNAASTRLRCYAIAEAINRYGLGEARIGHGDADVVVMQKLVDHREMFLADEVAKHTVYDLDDVIEPMTRQYVSLYADMVTTDTECRAASIRQWFRGPVHVIPDPIDYEDGPPWPVVEPQIDGAVWFGNYPNFESVRPLMLELQRLGWRIGAISDLSPERANMPGLELIPWSLESFPRELRKWRCAVLSHAGADPCKSANKMVAAYYLGVPCITHESRDYYEVGRPWLGSHITHVAQLYKHQRWLSDERQRVEDVGLAQTIIYERYRAEVIALRAMEVYAQC